MNGKKFGCTLATSSARHCIVLYANPGAYGCVLKPSASPSHLLRAHSYSEPSPEIVCLASSALSFCKGRTAAHYGLYVLCALSILVSDIWKMSLRAPRPVHNELTYTALRNKNCEQPAASHIEALAKPRSFGECLRRPGTTHAALRLSSSSARHRLPHGATAVTTELDSFLKCYRNVTCLLHVRPQDMGYRGRLPVDDVWLPGVAASRGRWWHSCVWRDPRRCQPIAARYSCAACMRVYLRDKQRIRFGREGTSGRRAQQAGVAAGT